MNRPDSRARYIEAQADRVPGLLARIEDLEFQLERALKALDHANRRAEIYARIVTSNNPATIQFHTPTVPATF